MIKNHPIFFGIEFIFSFCDILYSHSVAFKSKKVQNTWTSQFSQTISYQSPFCDVQEQIAKEAGHRAELLDTWVWLQVIFPNKQNTSFFSTPSLVLSRTKIQMFTQFLSDYVAGLKNVCKHTQQIWKGGGLR